MDMHELKPGVFVLPQAVQEQMPYVPVQLKDMETAQLTGNLHQDEVLRVLAHDSVVHDSWVAASIQAISYDAMQHSQLQAFAHAREQNFKSQYRARRRWQHLHWLYDLLFPPLPMINLESIRDSEEERLKAAAYVLVGQEALSWHEELGAFSLKERALELFQEKGYVLESE